MAPIINIKQTPHMVFRIQSVRSTIFASETKPTINAPVLDDCNT